jgi:hypothetical protein
LYGSKKNKAKVSRHSPPQGDATRLPCVALSRSLNLYYDKDADPTQFTLDWKDGPYIAFTKDGITSRQRTNMTIQQAEELVSKTLADFGV